MDHPLMSLIDQQIAKAQAEGQFEDLAGAGKPLDLTGNAADAVLSRMMQEADATSPLVELKRQIAHAQACLPRLAGEARHIAMTELADMQMKLAMEIERFRKHG